MPFKRLINDEILKYADTDDVLVLLGARQVGKTHILYWLDEYLRDKGEQTHYIDLEDSRLVRILNAGVDSFLAHVEEEGLNIVAARTNDAKLFILIDEVQYLENPSSFLKLIADHHKYLKLIVSGSSSFALKGKFQDALVGRTVTFEVFNLSFEEFLAFKQYRFVKERGTILASSEKKIGELTRLYEEYARYGGYPKVVLTDAVEKKEKYLQQIVDTYLRKDIRDLAHVKEIEKFNKLLEVLSAQSGQLLNVEELSRTCQLAKQTVEHYLFILEQTYVIKLVRPYSRNVRSELFKTPKVFFYDSGLMQQLWLKVLPRELTGSAFETSVFAELVKKNGRADVVHFWRTTDKKEIDFIITRDKAPLPIEAKLNFAQFRASAVVYFKEKYRVKEHCVVGLYGKKSDLAFIYPWELSFEKKKL